VLPHPHPPPPLIARCSAKPASFPPRWTAPSRSRALTSSPTPSSSPARWSGATTHKRRRPLRTGRRPRTPPTTTRLFPAVTAAAATAAVAASAAAPASRPQRRALSRRRRARTRRQPALHLPQPLPAPHRLHLLRRLLPPRPWCPRLSSRPRARLRTRRYLCPAPRDYPQRRRLQVAPALLRPRAQRMPAHSATKLI
jgi:hypothetical protein